MPTMDISREEVDAYLPRLKIHRDGDGVAMK